MARNLSMVIAVATLLSACSGATSAVGVDQPIRVRHAQLRAGPLPGAQPSDGGVASGPTTINEDVGTSYTVALGREGVTIRGRASTDTVAVAMAFVDLGTAHWVFPVGAPDLANGGEYQWSAIVDFARDIPPGMHTLGFAAIDANGVAGVQRTWQLCFVPDVPDNGYTCGNPNVDGGLALPNTVIAITWNRDVDLDLVVVTPSGKVVSGKQPNTAAVDGGVVPDDVLADPSTGRLTRDSNPGCAIDGRRLESLVFDGPPEAGTYRVYASLFAACGEPSVVYALSLYQPGPSAGGAGGTSALVETSVFQGQLLALQATGGSTLGTFVTQFTFP